MKSYQSLYLLLIALLLTGTISPANSAVFCSDFPNFTIDGSDPQTGNSTQIVADADCIIRNFPQDYPLMSTFNFLSTTELYLLVFNNVVLTGNISCANINHSIWFANSVDFGLSSNCQTLMVPVEYLRMEIPLGLSTVGIGEPFTYMLTFPLTENNMPSPNDLHSVQLWIDLNDSAADLSLVSVQAYSLTSGAPITLFPQTDSNAPGGVYSDSNLSYEGIPVVYAGEQIGVEFTLVLNDSPFNTDGLVFGNTAKWHFSRAIDKNADLLTTPDEFYANLPGNQGVPEPLTISIAGTTQTSSNPDSGGGGLGFWFTLALLLLRGKLLNTNQ